MSMAEEAGQRYDAMLVRLFVCDGRAVTVTCRLRPCNTVECLSVLRQFAVTQCSTNALVETSNEDVVILFVRLRYGA